MISINREPANDVAERLTGRRYLSHSAVSTYQSWVALPSSVSGSQSLSTPSQSSTANGWVLGLSLSQSPSRVA